MAQYHLHRSYGSRDGGQSALAKLRYVLREGKYARGRDDLEKCEWGHLPAWCAGAPFPLFASADRYERSNGRLYVEIECALPAELDLEQCIALARELADAVAAIGLPYVWAIHAGRPVAPGEPRNRHLHLIFLERINDGVARDPALWFRRANKRRPAAGGAAKDRRLKGHTWLPAVRGQFEKLINGALERAGRPERVTADSHRVRIARAEAAGDLETAEYLRRHPPGRHIGPTASAIERGRPGRPGRPTERGDLARARDAEAARLRAELDRIEAERQEHRAAAVAAAQDAGVDSRLVTAAQAGEPDTVIALDDATEIARKRIRAAARAVGLGEDAIDGIRRKADPDHPDLGWAAVVTATGARRERREAAVAAALDAGIDIEAARRLARRQNEDELDCLERLTEEWQRVAAKALAVGFTDKEIRRLRDEAESTEAGSGAAAVSTATRDRTEQMQVAEEDARKVLVDPLAVYEQARLRNEDGLQALERETAEAGPIVTAARAAGLDDATIRGIRDEAEDGQRWAAVARVTREWVQAREDAEAARQEEERLQRELTALAAEVRAVSDGKRRIDAKQRILCEAKGRSLTLEERLSVVKDVQREITAELDQRATAIGGEAGGGELLRTAERRRGGALRSLAARERALHETEQMLLAAGEFQAMVTELGPNGPHDPVPVVNDALSSAVATGDGWFLEGVVSVWQARNAQPAQEGSARIGYDAQARDAAAGHYFGSALVDAFAWCVRVIRRVLLEACHKVLGGGGESGVQVEEALTAVRRELQEHESAVAAAAERFAIDVPVFSKAALAEGRHPVPVLEEETASRRKVLSDAQAAGVDYEAVYISAEQVKLGSGLAAVEAATERLRNARSEAESFGLDVDAICATAQSRGEDPARVLEDEATSCQNVLFAADLIGMSAQRFEATFAAAEAERRGSGYMAVGAECIQTSRREKIREVLPFEYSASARTRVGATSEEFAAQLLEWVAGEHFVHGELSAILAEPHGSAEERARAEHAYHLPAIRREWKRLKAERSRWSKPTLEEAKDAVLARSIPELAERVRAACDSVTDIESVLACAVEEDRVRRGAEALKGALRTEEAYVGSSSRYRAASDQALSRAAATTGDAFRQRVVVVFQAQESYGAGLRAQAEEVRLERLRRKKEAESHLTQEQAEAAAVRDHDAELLRALEEVCRRVQLRTIDEIVHDRVRDRQIEPSAARSRGVDRPLYPTRRGPHRAQGFTR